MPTPYFHFLIATVVVTMIAATLVILNNPKLLQIKISFGASSAIAENSAIPMRIDNDVLPIGPGQFYGIYFEVARRLTVQQGSLNCVKVICEGTPSQYFLPYLQCHNYTACDVVYYNIRHMRNEKSGENLTNHYCRLPVLFAYMKSSYDVVIYHDLDYVYNDDVEEISGISDKLKLHISSQDHRPISSYVSFAPTQLNQRSNETLLAWASQASSSNSRHDQAILREILADGYYDRYQITEATHGLHCTSYSPSLDNRLECMAKGLGCTFRQTELIKSISSNQLGSFGSEM